MFHPWSYSLVVILVSIRFIESISSSHFSSHPSVDPLPCQQVLKRGTVSVYLIYAFPLNPPSSLKHFARIFFCRPSSFIDVKIFVLGIQLLYSSPLPSFFFQTSSLNLSLITRVGSQRTPARLWQLSLSRSRTLQPDL
jgi:hypothetical protein